jgi:hypothetical protein
VFLQTVLHRFHMGRTVAFAVAVALIAVATFTGQPVLLTGVVLAGLVATMVILTGRATAD